MTRSTCTYNGLETLFWQGPLLEPTGTHLHKALGDANVLTVKFADVQKNSSTDPYSAYKRIAKNGIMVGLRRYQFFGGSFSFLFSFDISFMSHCTYNTFSLLNILFVLNSFQRWWKRSKEDRLFHRRSEMLLHTHWFHFSEWFGNSLHLFLEVNLWSSYAFYARPHIAIFGQLHGKVPQFLLLIYLRNFFLFNLRHCVFLLMLQVFFDSVKD